MTSPRRSTTILTSRTRTIVAVLVLLGLPVGLALVEAMSYGMENRNNGTLVSSGEERKYLLYVPRSYNPARPTPLVIGMHGAGGWPAMQMNLSAWNRLAESEGFIAVYPSGIEGSGPRIWRAAGGAGLSKDVRFIADLIDTLEATYNIDPARIYANGLSNGGGMAFVLSCALSGRIAAVGMVAAAHITPWSWCTDDRPVPMIAFHGTADRMTPYDGGRSPIARNPFPSIPAWTANWARRNHCRPHPNQSVVAGGVIRIAYNDCADDADAVLYRIEGGGHTWPGGRLMPEWLLGPTSTEIDATTTMWAFFREHPRRAGSAQPGAKPLRLIERVADRIARAALLNEAALSIGFRAADIHALHDDEPLSVSVARVVVFSVKEQRGSPKYSEQLRSGARYADDNAKRSLGMLADGGAYLTNIVQAASDRQIVRNAEDADAALELTWNEQLGPDDVNDMTSILGLLRSLRDSGAVDRARRAIRSELERAPALLEPFAAERAPSPELVRSRQRVAALLAGLR